MLQLTRLQLIAYPTKHLPVELPVITFTGLLFAETIPLTSKGSQSTEQTYRSQNDTIPTAINFHAANSRANNRTQTTCHSEIISALVPRTIPFAILAQRTPIVGNANSERGGRLSLQPQCKMGGRNFLVNLNVRVTQHHIHVRRSAHRTDRAGRKDNCNVV